MAKGYIIFTEQVNDAAVIGERRAAAESDAVIISGFEMPGG